MAVISLFRKKNYLFIFASACFVILIFFLDQVTTTKEVAWLCFYLAGFLMHFLMCFGLSRGSKELLILFPFRVQDDDSDQAIFSILISFMIQMMALIFGFLGMLNLV